MWQAISGALVAALTFWSMALGGAAKAEPSAFYEVVGVAEDDMLKLRAVVGTATAEQLQQLDELRNRWRESNVAGDPLAVMANALGDIAAALERTDR